MGHSIPHRNRICVPFRVGRQSNSTSQVTFLGNYKAFQLWVQPGKVPVFYVSTPDDIQQFVLDQYTWKLANKHKSLPIMRAFLCCVRLARKKMLLWQT